VTVAGHFSCIGLDIPDGQTLARLIPELSRSATRSAGPLGTRLLWQDTSGAGLAMFLDDGGGVTCAKPTFAARSQLYVKLTAALDDPRGCPYCGITTVEVLEAGEMVYPLGVELDDTHLGPLSGPTHVKTLSVTAFGESIRMWADVAAYKAADEPGEPRLAAQSLIPSGLFGPGSTTGPVRAQAIITGIVTEAERKTNGYSGDHFDWCKIDTVAAALDVVLEAQAQPPRIGQVIQGTFWLVAHRPGTGRPLTTVVV
jgi:hypothetical protein